VILRTITSPECQRDADGFQNGNEVNIISTEVKNMTLCDLDRGVMRRALKRLCTAKLLPLMLASYSHKSDYEDMTEEAQPKPNDWDAECCKPELGDFTLAEYTEKVIMYGLVMVNHPLCRR